MGNLCRQTVVLEGRHKAHDCLWGSGPDGSDVGVAGGRVIRLHVDAASSAYDLAAVDRPLEGDAWNAERSKVACSQDALPLQVPKQALDVAGGWHDRFGEVLRFLCQNIFGQRFRNILALADADCPHSRQQSTVPEWEATHARNPPWPLPALQGK